MRREYQGIFLENDEEILDTDKKMDTCWFYEGTPDALDIFVFGIAGLGMTKKRVRGELVLTNKRIIFIGKDKGKTIIPFEKIAGLEATKAGFKLAQLIILTDTGANFKFGCTKSLIWKSKIKQMRIRIQSSFSASGLKYCTNCGKQIQPNWKVCGYCGEKL